MSKPKTFDRPTIVVIHGAGLLGHVGPQKAIKAIGRAKVKPGAIVAHVHIRPPGKGPKAK